jgi:hypothetical protein
LKTPDNPARTNNMAQRTALYAKKQPGGVLAIEDMSKSTGNRWFVDSGSSTGADDTGYGESPDKPFLTLDYAIGVATANNGDIIYVMPGHAETYSTTGTKITFDKAGLTIICLGEGADRPTFTFSHVDATMLMSAASVVFKNFLFVTGIDSVVTFCTVSGADCTVEGEVRDAANVEVIDAFTVTGHRFKAKIVHHGDRATGDANNSTIALNSVDGANIYVEAFGIAQVGIVDLRSAASHEVVVNGVFEVVGTTDLSKNVVDTITGSTYQALGFDVAAGKRFSGNTITAIHSIDDFTVSSLGAGAITAAVIDTDAIDADAIADGAIDAGAIATNAIAAAKIAGDAITNAKIADDAIAVENFADGAIAANVIAADAITADKIADDAIGADQIGAAAIVAATFGAGAIDAAAIATGAIDADAIADNAIDAGAIAANAITAAKIATGAITAGTFAAGAIDDAAIDTGAITAAKLAADAITSDKIADDAIGADQIGAAAIVAATFGAGAIDANAIADNAIDAGAIAGDAITNAKIADNALATEQFALSAGEKTTDGIVVTKTTAAIPQTGAAAIFTVTGHVLLKRILGVVTVAIGNVANVAHLRVNSTGAGATTDICLAAGGLDIDNDAADTMYEITGTFADAMVATLNLPKAPTQATEIVIPPGTIELACAGNDGGGGRVRWSITYVPLESGAQVVAA